MERENLNIENVEIFVNKKVSFERSKIQKDHIRKRDTMYCLRYITVIVVEKST